MSRYFLFSSYHNTKLRPRDNNTKRHTRLKFQILLLSKSKVTAGFVVFLHTAHYKKGNQGAGQSRARIGAYRVVQTLYYRELHLKPILSMFCVLSQNYQHC